MVKSLSGVEPLDGVSLVVALEVGGPLPGWLDEPDILEHEVAAVE